MKTQSRLLALCSLIALALCVAPVLAQTPEPIRITSEQAFDAVVGQVDPLSGQAKKVALVDTRTRAEFFWVGTTASVTKIVMKKGQEIVPDMGKAFLVQEGKFIEFEKNGRKVRAKVDKVDSVELTPIAISIPYLLWDETTATLAPNGEEYANFVADVEALATEQDVDVVIFFCRSGGRSQACLAPFNTELFDEIYEIDQPNLKSGRGGFEGTTYSNVYLGYRGFPQRLTFIQDNESVAWKDAGLPIKIGANPLN